MKKMDYSSTLFLLLFILTFISSTFCIYHKHPITEYCSTREPILSFLQTLVEILIEVEADDNEAPEVKLNTLISIRLYLENNDNCPDDEQLQNDMVSILVKCFDSEDSKMHKEAANALGLFANGTEKQANMVIEHNAIPHFLKLLSTDNEELQREALFALMKIMGHGPTFRDYCIKSGFVERMVNLVEDPETSIDVLYDAAVMMYYICQEGEPKVPFDTVVKIIPAIKTLMELKSDHEKTSLTSQQRKEAQLMQKKVKYLNTKAGKFMYCIYAGNIAIKTRAGPTGDRPKPEQVSNERLDELLQDFDANATPLGARGNNGGGRETVADGRGASINDDDMDEEQQMNSFL